MKLEEKRLVIILFVIFLVSSLFVPREYRYLLKVVLLISLIPFVYLGLKRLRNIDKEQGTKTFNHSILSMTIVLAVLTIGYYLMGLDR